jgi:large subunit ribosomal protein L25
MLDFSIYVIISPSLDYREQLTGIPDGRKVDSKDKFMKKENPKLVAEIRTIKGRKVKKLRAAGQVPATMYGKGMESVSLQIDGRELSKVFEETGEAGLVDLMIDKKETPILLRNPQWGVVNDQLVHIDCFKVDLSQKITANIPVELIGESMSVKSGNILMEVTSEIEVEALPTDLPEKIEVDLSALAIVEDVITVADLKIGDDKVEVKTQGDQVVVKTEEPKEEEIIEETVAPGDVPATEQKEEGEEEEATNEEKTEEKAD